jgi:hypothetical protein
VKDDAIARSSSARCHSQRKAFRLARKAFVSSNLVVKGKAVLVGRVCGWCTKALRTDG